MVDVARLAGVSHQTVSRVLNDHPHVSAKTRAGVLAAIRDLGYRPNAAARTLATGRTKAFGVISVDNTLYGPSSMLYGLEQAAPPDYMVAIARLDNFDRHSLHKAVERFLGQAVEGIIVVAPQTAAVEALINLKTEIPLVVDQVRYRTRRCRRWPSTTWPARPAPPSTCSTWATRPCITWAGRRAGWMPRSGPTAGATPCAPPERPSPTW